MRKPIFTGSGVAIATPMYPDGTFNYSELEKLIDFQIDNGTNAIIICGTTGEASTMTDDEHQQSIVRCVEHVNGRVPVIAGTGSNDTQYAVELTKFAKEAGADASLQVTPYYNKTTQAGLIRHFNEIADKSDLPMILYNVPSRTGMTISPDTYAELAKNPLINGVKEASGNFTAITEAISKCPDDFYFWSGNDDNIVPLMSLGGVGVISVLANIMPRETSDICKLFFDGKIKESSKIQVELIDIINLLFCEVNPIPVKAALNFMGYDVGSPRTPLVDMSDTNKEKLYNCMKKYKLV